MLAFVSLLLLVIGQTVCSHENCDKIEGLKPFNPHQIYKCTSNGFFADETDRNCRKYMVCARNTRSFTTLYLTCPKGTYFNPDIEDCTSGYDCPYEDESDSTTDISDTCNYTSDPDYFRCSDSGNFADDNDPTCRSYFYCLIIHKPDLYLRIKRTCPRNFYFNRYTKTCDDEYVCPCSTTTSRPTSTTRRERTVTSSTETTNHDVTIPYNGCDYVDDPDYFTCTVGGIFKNKNDITCRSYYKCTDLLIGWIKTKYNCPANTYFNPSTGHCDSTYRCPCSAVTEQPAKTTTSPKISTITSRQTTIDGETTSSDTCVYNEDPNYFTCTVQGRFRNNNDKYCKSYYLCRSLRSGRIIQTKYDCPGNSLFNPKKQLCDVKYRCPCTEESTTTTTSPTKTSRTAETSPEVSPTSMSSEEPDKSSTSSQIEYTTKEYSTSNSASPRMSTPNQDCAYNENSDYFTCTVPGRFRNNNDLECKSYYYCIVSRSGKIYQTKYVCPENSYFNPNTQLCDVKYKCPCSNPSTGTISTTPSTIETSVETTTITVNDDTLSTQVSTDQSTNEDQSSSYLPSTTTTPTTTSTPTTTTSPTTARTPTTITTTENSDLTTPNDKCIYDDNPDYFTCTVKGRFRNNNDRDCKSYYLCTVLRSGRIIQTKYDCPGNSLFNPKKQLCDVKYKCPCYNPSTSTISTTTSSTETSVVTTTTTIKDDTISTEINTEGTTYETQSTSFPSTTPTTTITPTTENSDQTTPNDKCIYDDNPNYFTCTVKGRFRNNNDRNCKSYYLCSVLGSGRIIQTKYDCPGNSLFNPKKQLCDVKYRCPCTEESTTTTTSPTKTSRTAETSPEGSPTSKSSEEPDKASTSSETDYTTKEHSTSHSASSRMSTPNQDCAYNENPDYFTCTVPGRFRNNNDLECKSYYYCFLSRSGRIYQTKYVCPENSYFNPQTQLCDIGYKCPCTTFTTVPTSTSNISTAETTTVETAQTTTSTNLPDESTTTTTITTTTEGNCPFYNSDPNYFNCNTNGRFRNNNDKDCKTYFLCSKLSSGLFLKTEYSCPGNSLFNPVKNLCDVYYKCEC